MATRTRTSTDIFTCGLKLITIFMPLKKHAQTLLLLLHRMGTISHCNQALLRQTGYADVELFGKPIDLLLQSYNVQDCELLEKYQPCTFRGAIHFNNQWCYHA